MSIQQFKPRQIRQYNATRQEVGDSMTSHALRSRRIGVKMPLGFDEAWLH